MDTDHSGLITYSEFLAELHATPLAVAAAAGAENMAARAERGVAAAVANVAEEEAARMEAEAAAAAAAAAGAAAAVKLPATPPALVAAAGGGVEAEEATGWRRWHAVRVLWRLLDHRISGRREARAVLMYLVERAKGYPVVAARETAACGDRSTGSRGGDRRGQRRVGRQGRFVTADGVAHADDGDGDDDDGDGRVAAASAATVASKRGGLLQLYFQQPEVPDWPIILVALGGSSWLSCIVCSQVVGQLGAAERKRLRGMAAAGKRQRSLFY